MRFSKFLRVLVEVELNLKLYSLRRGHARESNRGIDTWRSLKLTLIMFSTIARRADLAQTLKTLLPKELPPVLVETNGNLYEVLSRTPDGGVGKQVHQQRWTGKKIDDCYWTVTRTRFKDAGKHGRAWGKLTWRGAYMNSFPHTHAILTAFAGKLVNNTEERIPGSLKYSWAVGKSKGIPWPPAIEKN